MKLSFRYLGLLLSFVLTLFFSLDVSAQVVVIRPRKHRPAVYYAPPPPIPAVYYVPPPPVIIVKPKYRHRNHKRRW